MILKTEEYLVTLGNVCNFDLRLITKVISMRPKPDEQGTLKDPQSGVSKTAPPLGSQQTISGSSSSYCQGENGAVPTGSLTLLLLSISKRTRALVGIKLAEIGLANGQDEMLLLLEEGSPKAVMVLADGLGVRPSTVSKTLERLVQGGLALRETSRSDSRMTLVTITASGIMKREEIMAMRDRLEINLTDKIQSDNRLHLADTLRSVNVMLKQRLSRLR